MIHIEINNIINKIREYKPLMVRPLEREAIAVLHCAAWSPDGTGRGVQAHFNKTHYYIVFDKPVLVPFNTIGDYTIEMTCHLRVNSKSDDDYMKFSIELSLE